MTTPSGDAIAEVAALFAARGAEAYGEDVTMSVHMRQSAYYAVQAGASPTVVAAALLHDVGHLLHDLPDDVASVGVDTRHEDAGAHWLASRFVDDVAAACRLHVAAKRYLVAVDPSYADELSEASRISLALQGGPMTADERAAFEQEPSWQTALEVRRYDDLAKDPTFAPPPLEAFGAQLRAALR